MGWGGVAMGVKFEVKLKLTTQTDFAKIIYTCKLYIEARARQIQTYKYTIHKLSKLFLFKACPI